VIDVGAVMEAFEQINQCFITIFGKVEELDGGKQLIWLVQAMDTKEDVPDPKVLGSVKCHLGSGGHRTMEAAVMWALYQLDAQIARYEMRNNPKT
jgi:hypothetical protein